MASSKSLSLVTLFLLAVSLSAAPDNRSPPPPPPRFLLDTIRALANSGYTAMSLTLQLIADSDIIRSNSTSSSLSSITSALTIFTPPDSAFVASGQPSLHHLLLHFAPVSLSSTSLLSLPYGSKIPTLSSSGSLYITTSGSDRTPVSINGVNISADTPIFEDQSVVVFPIDDFFSPNFSLQIAGEPSSCLIPPSICKLQRFSQLRNASAALKSRGYLIMASFLDLQLFGFLNTPPLKLTVFAPVDEALITYSGDVTVYQSLLMRHLLPCFLPWRELNELGKGTGTVFEDYANGFSMNITSADGLIFLNGAIRISFPDMYSDDWIVIHGLHESIPLLKDVEIPVEDLDMKSKRRIQESISPDRSEF